MLGQLIQVGGALLVLTAFMAVQAKRMSPASLSYLLPNLVGSGILTILAAMDHEYGFVLLEGVWACVSGWGVVARVRGRIISARQ